jgi:hypothetical protein
VLAFWVVEQLDVVKHVLPCGLAGGYVRPPDPLAFQRLEESLDDVEAPIFVKQQSVAIFGCNEFLSHDVSLDAAHDLLPRFAFRRSPGCLCFRFMIGMTVGWQVSGQAGAITTDVFDAKGLTLHNLAAYASRL